MKKKLSIILSVLVLTFGSVSYAAGSSLIGKKVQTITTILFNGKQMNTDAIVIDGVTYAPVRSVAEMSGLTVKYEGGVVKMDGNNTAVTDEIKLSRISSRVTEINQIIESNQASLLILNQSLEKYKTYYAAEKLYESTGIKVEDSEDYKRVLTEITKSETQIQTLQKEFADLERQKAELTSKK